MSMLKWLPGAYSPGSFCPKGGFVHGVHILGAYSLGNCYPRGLMSWGEGGGAFGRGLCLGGFFPEGFCPRTILFMLSHLCIVTLSWIDNLYSFLNTQFTHK